MIDILIPLGTGSVWQNNELRYALRSLCENVKCEWQPVVVGGEIAIPFWYRGKYVVLERPVTNVAYENYRDTLSKLRWYAENHTGEFVYSYDDTCLLREVNSIEDFKNVPLEIERGHYKDIRKSKHGRTINQSVAILDNICDKNNNQDNPDSPDVLLYVYETHIPRRYDCQKLRQMFFEYNPDRYNPPYAPATLYFNLYGADVKVPMEMENTWKAGFYCEDEGVACYLSDSKGAIDRAVDGKMYLNYNNNGLSMRDKNGGFPLKEWLENRWPDKCKWEL